MVSKNVSHFSFTNAISTHKQRLLKTNFTFFLRLERRKVALRGRRHDHKPLKCLEKPSTNSSLKVPFAFEMFRAWAIDRRSIWLPHHYSTLNRETLYAEDLYPKGWSSRHDWKGRIVIPGVYDWLSRLFWTNCSINELIRSRNTALTSLSHTPGWGIVCVHRIPRIDLNMQIIEKISFSHIIRTWDNSRNICLCVALQSCETILRWRCVQEINSQTMKTRACLAKCSWWRECAVREVWTACQNQAVWPTSKNVF